MLKKLFTKESLAESALIVVLFQILFRGLGILRGVIFARALGPFQYGIYSLAVMLVSVLVPVVTLGIPSSFSRYIPYYENKGGLDFFVKKTYSLMFILSVVWMIIFLFFSKNIAHLIFHTENLQEVVILCGFYIPVMVFMVGIESTFMGLRIFKVSSSIRAVEITLGTILGIVMVCTISKSSFWALFSQVFTGAIVIGIFGYLLKEFLNQQKQCKNFTTYTEHEFFKKILRFSIWFLFIPVLQHLFKYTDRWMLNFLLGERGLVTVGIYSVGSRVAGILFMIGTAASRVLTPNLSAMWDSSKRIQVINTLNTALKIYSLILLYLAIPIVVFRKVIISWLFGLPYIESVEIIPYLCVFAILNVLGWVLGSFSLVIEKPQINFGYSILGVSINLFLNYHLIKIWGMKGAAISTMFSYWIALIFLMICLQRHGLMLSARTIISTLLPFLLLLNVAGIIVGILLITLLLYFTELILVKDEKRHIKKSFKERF